MPQGRSLPRTNWAGNYVYRTSDLHLPETIEEAQHIVRTAASISALGSGHSFNAIADNGAQQVSMGRFDHIVQLDRSSRTVTVGAGMRYGELCRYLDAQGYALHNLASLPHISIVGACATATHGSGIDRGNLATAVTALEFIAADGNIVRLVRGRDPDFFGAVVALGALGVVTRITLEIEPAFDMRQDVYRGLPFAQLARYFSAIMSSGYSVSVFTDWQGETVDQVWVKRRLARRGIEYAQGRLGRGQKTNLDSNEDEDPWQHQGPWRAEPAERHLHPVAAQAADNCTPQLGQVGPWHERLPHFKLDFTPSSGQELQSEYFVPISHAAEALQAMRRLGPALSPQLMISEVRVIAADELWMSPCYQTPCMAIHCTWQQETPPERWDALRRLLARMEEALAPFAVRPHWGKLFTLEPQELQARYPMLGQFKSLLQRRDPEGKFRNEFLRMQLGV